MYADMIGKYYILKHYLNIAAVTLDVLYWFQYEGYQVNLSIVISLPKLQAFRPFLSGILCYYSCPAKPSVIVLELGASSVFLYLKSQPILWNRKCKERLGTGPQIFILHTALSMVLRTFSKKLIFKVLRCLNRKDKGNALLGQGDNFSFLRS